MASTKFYKQSVLDHASLSITVVTFEENHLNSKIINLFIDNIRKSFECINLQPLNSDSSISRKVYFNYKRDFTAKEKEWENFQQHHRPFGLLCLSEFKTGNDLKRILDFYISEKEKLTSSIYDSRLIFIYDDSSESIFKHIKRSFGNSDDILSSVDSETGEIVQTEMICKDFNEELEYIQESFVQNEILWYRKPYMNISRINSSSSFTDSTGSSHSYACKISSLSSEIFQPISINDSPIKSFETNSSLEYSFDSDMHKFLKSIFDKLYQSLSNREYTLMSKIEQTKARPSISEVSSDSASILSIDDCEFNLSDPFDQDNKKYQDENRFIKGNKSRQYLGKLYKQTADLCLLCGNYFESYHYYQLAICYFRKINDQLWLAGAEEGLCCSWIIYNFPSLSQPIDPQSIKILHEKTRQLFLTQTKIDQPSAFLNIPSNPNSVDQNDFSFLKKFTTSDMFRNAPEINNINELNEKYHSCISRYKKILKNKSRNLYPINVDSIIKATRFFVDQHKFLEASNFLKMIKTDVIQIQNNLELYHNTLAQLYCQMGFTRKSALHKYKQYILMNNRTNLINVNNRKQINEQKIAVLIDILNDFNVKNSELFNEKSANDDWITLILEGLHDNGSNEGCQSIKLQVVLELYHITKWLNTCPNTILGLGLSILDNWYLLISGREYERLVVDLNNFCKSNNGNKESKMKNVCVVNLPRLIKVILSKLPEYLVPKQPVDVNEKSSVFIYTPLKGVSPYGRPVPPAPVIWICGEECEIVLQFDNPIQVPIHLTNVKFLLTNVIDSNIEIWIPSEGSSIHYLQPNNKNIHCHFVVVPNLQNLSIGTYRITNVSYQLTSILNITFFPHKIITDTILQRSIMPEIKLYPMMPQLRILSSITEQLELPLFKKCKLPASTVSTSNLILYNNEVLESSLFLSNESKELDIDQIVCLLDELDLNITTNTLISRFADQEFSNRKGCDYRMISYSTNNFDKCLPIKSISSLKDLAYSNSENPSLPTEAILKYRIDTTNEQFCRELFEKLSINNNGNLNPLWMGQLKFTIQYWSNNVCGCDGNDDSFSSSDVEDVVIVKETMPTLCHTYRESICLINCHLMAALCVINYRIDNQLNLEMTLMNFTDNKMNIEIFWKDIKFLKGFTVIAPSFEMSDRSVEWRLCHRNSSTELFSHIYNFMIPYDLLQLKSAMLDHSINSNLDLTNYIQTNLKIRWIMKDKRIDKVRQGCVNLTRCNCYFSQEMNQNCYNIQLSIGHEVQFSINDLLKIWLCDNVKLEMIFPNSTSGDSPTLPDNTGVTIHIFDGIIYQIVCHFQQSWPPFLSEDIVRQIILLPSVVPNKISTHSFSSSDNDNTKLTRFIFAGNTSLNLQKESFPLTEMSGFIMFLVPGTYNINCHLSVSNNDNHKWQSEYLVLAESDKYQLHVA